MTTMATNPMHTTIICHVSFHGFHGIVLSDKLKRALVANHQGVHNGVYIPAGAVLITTKDFFGFIKVCLVFALSVYFRLSVAIFFFLSTKV
jgi:hypothetical protein